MSFQMNLPHIWAGRKSEKQLNSLNTDDSPNIHYILFTSMEKCFFFQMSPTQNRCPTNSAFKTMLTSMDTKMCFQKSSMSKTC